MSDKMPRIDQKIELMAAVLIAVVIVATAWSAYQATLWGGIQVFLLRDVSSAGMQFTLKTIQQGQRTAFDSIIFIEYINALHNNDTELSNFYLARVRPELRVAIEAWLETKPFENPDAPPHPFVMKEYDRTFAAEAEQFAKQADLKLEEAQQANQNSDNYVLLTVLYASVLFVGSIITKFSSRQLRLIVLIAGLVIFSMATVMLISMPVAME
ncbi:MAG: hypothetical protein ACRD38_04115 [Nitrososphaerales archaeon]